MRSEAREKKPLAVLKGFLDDTLAETISSIHILPFYPYSSDDGFSVIDYRSVDPALGNWGDIERISARYDVMVDAVINHVSRRSAWFAAFAAGQPGYEDFFHVCDPTLDYSAVTRPRDLPLLTPVETVDGTKHLWTTFGEDQIDLNFANPQVLLEILDVLLFYSSKGASFLRLDAVGFLWKQLGTSSMHLPQTHALIRLMRLVMEAVAPHLSLVTETNVPQADNVSYLGNGHDEAHLVYQFPLPPLTLHAFQTGNACTLMNWIATLEPIPAGTAYLNFLASHDGIGLRPLEGILSDGDIAKMAARVEANGGYVTMRTLAEGGVAPYELNTTFLDAVCSAGDSEAERLQKFLAAETILLSVVGVPAIYLHSFLGTRNDHGRIAQTGRKRSINRTKLDLHTLQAELSDPHGFRRRVLDGHRRLIEIRRRRPAFHPNAGQYALPVCNQVFSILRIGVGDRIWALVNVSGQAVTVRTQHDNLGFQPQDYLVDLINSQPVHTARGEVKIDLPPFGAAWVGKEMSNNRLPD